MENEELEQIRQSYIQKRIRKTLALKTFKQIREVVDEIEAENARSKKIAIIFGIILLIVLVITIIAFRLH